MKLSEVHLKGFSARIPIRHCRNVMVSICINDGVSVSFCMFSVLFSLCPKRFAVVSELPVAYGAKQPTKQNCPGSIAVHPERSYIWHRFGRFRRSFLRKVVNNCGPNKKTEKKKKKCVKKLKKSKSKGVRQIGSKNSKQGSHRCRHPASCTRRWAGTQTLPGENKQPAMCENQRGPMLQTCRFFV